MMDDPEVSWIVLMADAQAGKTTSLIAALLATSQLDPAPAMVAGPDQDAMRELRDKIYATCLESPTLKNQIPPERNWNDRVVDLETMYCYLAFSGSRQRLRGRTCKRVFCTEVDVWRDSPRLGQSADLIRARTKAFPEHKIVYESTPTDENSTIDAFYRRTDRRVFQVPCPKCGEFQELRFFVYPSGHRYAGRGGIGGFSDDSGNLYTIEEARRRAHYICINGCKFVSSDRADIMPRGVWVPRGQRVTKAGKLVGKPRRPKTRVGYHLSTLYAEQKTFGEIAAEYLDAKERGTLREFFNNWLGLKYAVGSKLPTWKELGKRLAGDHARGCVHPRAWFLVASADVQADRVYWVVRGYGDRCTSWLVDWGVCYQDPNKPYLDDGVTATDLAQLDEEVLNKYWAVVDGKKNPRGLDSMRARLLGIDANHRTADVHAYVRGRPGDRVRAIRGDHKVDPSLGYRMNVVEKNSRTGEVYEGGLELWGIYVTIYKEDLLGRFKIAREHPGAFHFTKNIVHEGKDYLRQLTNEGPMTVKDKSGRDVTSWVVRDHGLGEHHWDNEVYNRAEAEMVTGGVWDEKVWQRMYLPQAEQEEKPDTAPRVSARDVEEIIVSPR